MNTQLNSNKTNVFYSNSYPDNSDLRLIRNQSNTIRLIRISHYLYHLVGP